MFGDPNRLNVTSRHNAESKTDISRQVSTSSTLSECNSKEQANSESGSKDQSDFKFTEDCRKQDKSTIELVTNSKLESAIPKKRQELLNFNGWGYKDSGFQVNEKEGFIQFVGDRYPLGGMLLPHFTHWVEDVFNFTIEDWKMRREEQKKKMGRRQSNYHPPIIQKDFMEEIKASGTSFSIAEEDRVLRAHGHTLWDIYTLRTGNFERIPDVVLWPESHAEVVKIVNLANTCNVAIIPFGGGTSVTRAIVCPLNERRMIISLDMSQMNRILWLDRNNFLVCCEAGIIGQDLNRCLEKEGFTTGHEPDSIEFSSLGGWVATRASGMKKNVYGNIEDIVVRVRMVTPSGVLEKNCQVPRMSCGPDLHHIILGSEGTLGVVTEVVLKVRPIPKCKKFGSIVFPDFETGVNFLWEVAKQRCQPASIRLMDNEQFKLGQSLKPSPGLLGRFVEGMKTTYLTRIKGFDTNSISVVTLVFEGEEVEVKQQQRKIYNIAEKFGGLQAGETNGERGYLLTYVIAYLRDFAVENDILGESFETSVSWDRTFSLCQNVKRRLAVECEARGIKYYMLSCRVTQTYDSGSCVYFYLAFNSSGVPNALQQYEELEEIARDEVISSGGSISHHHGVGKIRQKWLPSQISETGLSLYNAIKQRVDPNNIFACGNLVQRL